MSATMLPGNSKSDQIARTAVERTVSDVATIDEQIKEDELAIAENTSKVHALKDAIRTTEEDTKIRQLRIKRNKKRVSVFMRAKTELEVIDAEVE